MSADQTFRSFHPAGTAGSSQVDSAAPHGLVASDVKAGDIGQDPDQTYPSGDDAPGPGGGVDRHPITVTDAAMLRIALTIPGPDGIDLYPEDSSGTIVAASTNGATDEPIELVLPPNDTYTLVVHGWSITVPPLPYEVDTWTVPLAAGTGPLVIDSAPTSPVLGTSGTVTTSWAGLTRVRISARCHTPATRACSA